VKNNTKTSNQTHYLHKQCLWVVVFSVSAVSIKKAQNPQFKNVIPSNNEHFSIELLLSFKKHNLSSLNSYP